MKFKAFLFIVLVIVVLAVYGYSKAIPGAGNQKQEFQPQIAITPKSFDFGEIEYGKKLEYVFKVKNLGDEVLEIKRLSTSCGCTTAEISKEKILPGEEVELRVIYDTGAMSGSHAKGEQERIIYVKSNDLVNPQTEVVVHANVK